MNEMNCPIVEATIYRSEADIKRTGKIKLPAGLQKVIISNVSSKINQDSIRVNGRGLGSIISTDIKSKLGERTPLPEITSLLDELEQLYLEKAKLEAEKTGLVGKKSTRSYKYQLKIENLRETDSLITVFDRLPKSQSEEVEVEVKSVKPEPKETRLGIYEWEVEVAAKSEFIIEYHFVIEFPRGQNVYPLP